MVMVYIAVLLNFSSTLGIYVLSLLCALGCIVYLAKYKIKTQAEKRLLYLKKMTSWLYEKIENFQGIKVWKQLLPVRKRLVAKQVARLLSTITIALRLKDLLPPPVSKVLMA
jgi:ABC-type bacteriocin/lantibiotic exporter with double-glycine peptidase domain